MQIVIDIPKRYYESIKDIKAEITEIRDSWITDGYFYEAEAFDVALKIIDKHIKGGTEYG